MKLFHLFLFVNKSKEKNQLRKVKKTSSTLNLTTTDEPTAKTGLLSGNKNESVFDVLDNIMKQRRDWFRQSSDEEGDEEDVDSE